MRYFLDDVEMTAAELEKAREEWEFHGGCWGHQVIGLDIIQDDCMYFVRQDWEC